MYTPEFKTSQLREKLMAEGLQRSGLNSDPIKQFESWYAETCSTDISEQSAMILATVDQHGQPWQRTVLLKTFDEKGFVFFTNYSSRKAEHIETNNNVSLLFPWHPLGRQVKVTGTAEKISTAESLKYFLSRPRGSQIGAWASHQSKVVKNRALLDAMFDEMKHKFIDGEIPLPSFWGGYRIEPRTIEFWQARDSRLHDRFIYSKNESNDWFNERLAP
ncbi:MAG: pyridoxamine 5'-phosphate oxidase [Gammaproteobacteria bacterium]|nr:pyridoxamine 5'-phosphate oxidase [Gammaproteobacteria bacterium]MCW9031667.1 pyridoxamine 5'-phosphate oxidase [Gammaproteobacteria bacterium]